MPTLASTFVYSFSILLVVVCLGVLIFKFTREFIGVKLGAFSVGSSQKNVTPSEATDRFVRMRPGQIWRRVLVYFAVTRVFIFMSTFFYSMITKKSHLPLIDTLIDQWKIYDSHFYLGIAEQGYYTTEGFDRLFLCFYPLYPALIHLFHYVIPGYFLSGVFASNLFLLIGVYYLIRLVEWEYKDAEPGLLTAKFVLIMPFSFFFSITYTESVFFAMCVLCFYALRKKRWLLAGLFGMFAALTRNQGVLLLVPIFLELLYEQNLVRHFKSKNYRSFCRGLGQSLGALVLPPLGIGIYLLINKVVSGNWLQFLVYQREHWKQKFGFFADLLASHAGRLFRSDTVHYAFSIWLPGIVLFLLTLILLIVFARKLRLSYAAFALLYIVISFSPTGLLSGPRYASGLFVLYLLIALAARKIPQDSRWVLDFVFSFLLCFYAILFILKLVF